MRRFFRWLFRLKPRSQGRDLAEAAQLIRQAERRRRQLADTEPMGLPAIRPPTRWNVPQPRRQRFDDEGDALLIATVASAFQHGHPTTPVDLLPIDAADRAACEAILRDDAAPLVYPDTSYGAATDFGSASDASTVIDAGTGGADLSPSIDPSSFDAGSATDGGSWA